MNDWSTGFVPFAERMKAEGISEVFIDTFADYYQQLVEGETGLIPESEIQPVRELPDLETLDVSLSEVGVDNLTSTVVIKLNGGLGTSMGLDKAKSLLVVREGLTFLDIIARQALRSGVPLVLMNSFATDADTKVFLQRYPELAGKFLLSFLQNKAPKIQQNDLKPASWSRNADLEWCPPGHGDIYTVLVTSGTLDALLETGHKYAFVSNSDNLGAVLDTTILGFLSQNQIPFLMEVADRTEMDKKGGHLAQHRDGRLLLRESAQCPDGDQEAFQNVGRHRFFNTNSLWLDLNHLKTLMRDRDNKLGLPMIRNAKNVDPRDARSTPVYHLETAMGAAVAVFEGARALRVPRARFAPVKSTNELLAVRSDAYVLREDYSIAPNPKRNLDRSPLVVSLDSGYYKMLDDFESRFPHGAPSLVGCSRLDVKGDFKFGRNLEIKDDTQLVNESDEQVDLADGSVLKGASTITKSQNRSN